MRTTITDLAKQLGVSHVTVSNALRGTGRVSPALRARIQTAAAQAGYKPNAGARAIRDRQHGAVALLHGSGYDRGRLPLSVLEGLHDGIEAQGWRLLMTRLRDDGTKEHDLPHLLTEWAADGLIVNFGERIPEMLNQEIARHHLATIWLNARRDHDAVLPDDEQAGALAAEHLLKHGHRRIAYVDTSLCVNELDRAHSSVLRRQAGCERVCREARIPCQIVRRGYRGDVAADCIRAVLCAKERPSGFIGYGLSAVAPTIAIALELGLWVPKDISVIGFDYEPIGHLLPRVDSVQLPGRAMGRAAVELLAERLTLKGASVPSQVLPCTLVVEGSVASPP